MAEETAQEVAKEEKPVMAAVKSMTEERDKALIELLEGFIEMAKEGHLSDIALIGKIRGEPMTEFEWDSDNPLELLGALEFAKQEVINEMVDEEEPGELDD